MKTTFLLILVLLFVPVIELHAETAPIVAEFNQNDRTQGMVKSNYMEKEVVVIEFIGVVAHRIISEALEPEFNHYRE